MIEGDKIMNIKKSTSRLILPLILSIVALIYIMAMCGLILMYENYQIDLQDQYINLFINSSLCFYLAIAYMLINAKSENHSKKIYHSLVNILLLLFVVSICRLLRYYQTHFNIDRQNILANSIISEYMALKSFIGKIRMGTFINIKFMFSLCLLYIIILIAFIFSYVFNKMIIKDSFKESKSNFKDIFVNISLLSLGFEYNTVP